MIKTKNEEIVYLGEMLTATKKEDIERLKSIITRLTAISVKTVALMYEQ